MSRLKDLFKKTTNVQEPETEESKISGEEMPASENAPSVPEGLWVKCPKCGELLYKEDVVKMIMYVRNARDISGSRPRPESVWWQIKVLSRNGVQGFIPLIPWTI